MDEKQREALDAIGRSVQEAADRMTAAWVEFARRVNASQRRAN